MGKGSCHQTRSRKKCPSSLVKRTRWDPLTLNPKGRGLRIHPLASIDDQSGVEILSLTIAQGARNGLGKLLGHD